MSDTNIHHANYDYDFNYHWKWNEPECDQDIIDFLEEIGCNGDELLYPTDLKRAIVGKIEHFHLGDVILLDKDKCLEIMCEDGTLTMEDAIEHFYFNVLGSGFDGAPAYATFIN